KRAYCLKTQPATGETYPKSDLFNKAAERLKICLSLQVCLWIPLIDLKGQAAIRLFAKLRR
ncbi:hypothetical protein P4I53_22420, partial [Escherichia coli]|uniref:hypothetical protein n=1 Tax=Escherichia coli TaxID=562 RepID=UPI003CF572AB